MTQYIQVSDLRPLGLLFYTEFMEILVVENTSILDQVFKIFITETSYLLIHIQTTTNIYTKCTHSCIYKVFTDKRKKNITSMFQQK